MADEDTGLGRRIVKRDVIWCGFLGLRTGLEIRLESEGDGGIYRQRRQ